MTVTVFEIKRHKTLVLTLRSYSCFIFHAILAFSCFKALCFMTSSTNLLLLVPFLHYLVCVRKYLEIVLLSVQFIDFPGDNKIGMYFGILLSLFLSPAYKSFSFISVMHCVLSTYIRMKCRILVRAILTILLVVFPGGNKIGKYFWLLFL